MNELVNDELIRASQQGDRTAFERLLELIYDTIFRFALKLVGRVSDAEDVTQNVCVKLARVIEQFRFESAFTTWLYRLVATAAADWSRTQRRHQSYTNPASPELDNLGLGGELTDQEVQQIELDSELAWVLSTVAQMGEGYRETLVLVYAEGFNHREAGEVLGVKESTISWRLHEIRKRLKQEAQTKVELAQ